MDAALVAAQYFPIQRSADNPNAPIQVSDLEVELWSQPFVNPAKRAKSIIQNCLFSKMKLSINPEVHNDVSDVHLQQVVFGRTAAVRECLATLQFKDRAVLWI